MLKRYLNDLIIEDLSEKMVFLAGPRQVGKTILAKQVMDVLGGGSYYLWDNKEDRKNLLGARWPAETAIVVLDELHKFRKWKQWIKGEFDKHREHLKFLVTGSARLDVYRKGGDSLQGRYHHWRLHPFSMNELTGTTKHIEPMSELAFSNEDNGESFKALLKYSGFPEPIIAQSERTHRRWQKERIERFFREDVRDLENVRDISLLQVLSDLLPEKVGSSLSLNSIREDMEVSHRAVTHWIDIFERLYYIFRIRPYTVKTIRGLKKEAKAYMWDWTLVKDAGARFENMIASHLLKFCHYIEDSEGYKAELFYLRDVDKREVDFLVSIDRRPWFAVEAKTSGNVATPALNYFGERLHIPLLFQVTGEEGRDFLSNNVRVISASKFLSGLI